MHFYKLLTDFYFHQILFSYRLYLYLYFSASSGQTNGFALQEPFQIILNFISEHPLKKCFFLYWSIHHVCFYGTYWWTGNLVMDRKGTQLTHGHKKLLLV